MNKKIFREYDIRGVVGKDLTRDVVVQLGKGMGAYFTRHNAKKITVGRDGRNSSPDIRTWLIKGLNSVGIDVIDLGQIPTPVSYFSTHKMNVDGAVMITGSHNPPDFNGFKVTLSTESIYGREILSIYELIEAADFPSGNGSFEEYDILPEYIKDLIDRLNITRPVKVAIDPGNGVAGLTADPIIKGLGCETVVINDDVDGNFPNHHPDPTIEKNMEQLRTVVLNEGCELGIGFDGDADRIGIIDEKGNMVWGDQILAILSRDLLKDVRGALIIGEVKCSKLFFDDIKKHGGEPLMGKVGHSLAKAKMLETGAPLAGEMSGHIFYKHRFYGFDDAVYVACRFLEIVAKTEMPVSEYLSDWPETFNTPELRVDCPDEIKFQVVENVLRHFKQIDEYEVIDVDGMRVNMPGGWGLLRSSNTQPVVGMRFEAESEQRLQEIRSEVESVFIAERDKLL